jgi:hypothetical protein
MIEMEEILNAGEVETPPAPPIGGIPRQWLPGWIRWPLRVLFLPFVLMDVFAQKIARLIVRPPFVQAGHCLKRGNCCHYILLPQMRQYLNKLFLFWYTQVDGFYLRFKEPFDYNNKKVQVMGCRYLQKDGSCRHYHLRPLICRQWPRIEYFGPPQMLKGCGFKAVPRDRLNILK